MSNQSDKITLSKEATKGSSIERPVHSPPYGFGGPASPRYSPNTLPAPNHHSLGSKGKGHANSTDSDSCHSPVYKPMSTPEWEALQGLPSYDNDNSDYEPEEEPFEESSELSSRKRKQLEPATKEGGSSKRSMSPFCNNIEHVKVKCDHLNLQRSCDKNKEYSRRHVARIEVRLNNLEKENKVLKEILMESFNSQTKKLEELVRKNVDKLMERVMRMEKEEERNTRWGKQSLAYLKEEIDSRMKMEKNRVDHQLAIKDYNHNVVNSRVTNLYDNLEYLYEKQKEKNGKVEKFMKDVENKKK